MSGFRPENEALWVAPATDVLQEYGTARLAALEALDDEADVAAEDALLAAVLAPPENVLSPRRNCGLAGRGRAHLMDASTIIFEEWEKMTREAIVHCWVEVLCFTCVYECLTGV